MVGEGDEGGGFCDFRGSWEKGSVKNELNKIIVLTFQKTKLNKLTLKSDDSEQICFLSTLFTLLQLSRILSYGWGTGY